MRRAILACAALALAGCFDPQIPEGLACSSEGTCPPGQLCFGNRCELAEPCNPLAGGAECPGAFNCYVVNGESFDGACAPSAGEAPVGASCNPMVLNECQRGAGCIDGVCRAYCDFARFPDQTAGCNEGACRQLTEEVGACR